MATKTKKTLKPHPTGIRLFVEQDKIEEKRIGSIIIAQELQKAPVTGTVTKVGPDVEGYKRGDRVVFGRFAGHRFTIDDIDYLLIKDSDVLAVMK